MIVEELNRLNQRLKPRNVKEKMLKTGTYVCSCDPSAMDDLITDCITSGVKLAGLQHRVLYGTREIVIAAMSVTAIADRRKRSDNGDGLSCNSDDVVERQKSEGLSLFVFVINDNLIKGDD